MEAVTAESRWRRATIAERIAFYRREYPIWPAPGVWAWGPAPLWVQETTTQRYSESPPAVDA